MVRIAAIEPASIAEELELQIGSRILRINGQPVRDAIDYRFLEAEGLLELEVASPGCADTTIFEIDKDAGDPLGLVLEPDSVRQCANKCVFCFVDGNPATARRSLHLKDDDFRLSFTYGSYVTLTNLGRRGFQRLIDQRLSPLYVSVHATEPKLRERLLGVPLGGNIVEQLRELTAAGIEVHTQIVLCPEWNDGAALDRTIDDLWSIGPNVLSLSVVPVGLTRYNIDRPVRLLTSLEAERVIAQTERARQRALAERGIGWAYVADEMFFIAGQPVPPASYYDDWPLMENGVGSVRRLLDDFDAGFKDLRPSKHGRIAIVTGTRMQPVLEELAPRLRAALRSHVQIIGVRNRYFGETVTTAGLLPGHDIGDALGHGSFDVALIPAESLNDDERFVDNVTLDDLRARVPGTRLVAAYELTSALRAL